MTPMCCISLDHAASIGQKATEAFFQDLCMNPKRVGDFMMHV